MSLPKRLLALPLILLAVVVLLFVALFLKIKCSVFLIFKKYEQYELSFDTYIGLIGFLRNLPGWLVAGKDPFDDGFVKDGVNFDE